MSPMAPRTFAAIGLLALLCVSAHAIDRPRVDLVRVVKSERILELRSGATVVRRYAIVATRLATSFARGTNARRKDGTSSTGETRKADTIARSTSPTLAPPTAQRRRPPASIREE